MREDEASYGRMSLASVCTVASTCNSGGSSFLNGRDSISTKSSSTQHDASNKANLRSGKMEVDN